MALLVLVWVVKFLSAVVLVDIVLSWVQHPSQTPRAQLNHFTAPLYAPFHALVPPSRLGGIDIAPMLLIITLQLVVRLVVSI
jgi:uncharacterized protein YggT (Ycf19 family)